MTLSAARLAANQANAQRSTGPRTEAGKSRSRRNALKHGLTSTVVPLALADEPAFQARVAGVIATIHPQTEYQLWLCGRIATTTIKLDRLAAIEHQTRVEATDRAEFCWDEDQQAEANRIGGQLARHPSRTIGRLRRSLAGCVWLIDRWTNLADSADQGHWTDEQKNLAHDLIATPSAFRTRPPQRQLDHDGRAVVSQPSEAEFARAQVDELRDHLASVLDDDELAQLTAMADRNDLNNRDLARLRRYDRQLWNDHNQAFAQCQYESPHPSAPGRFLQSVPAHFFDSASPHAATEASPPTPIVPDEPRPEPISVLPNEPKAEIPNEPKPEIPNEPKAAAMPWAPAGLADLDPRLAALLEAGMPQPGDLDPDWCAAVVAARLGEAPSGGFGGPAPMAAASRAARQSRPTGG